MEPITPGRFFRQVALSATAGGGVAAAAAYGVAVLITHTRFWGTPRLFYQILFAAEVGWLAAFAAVIFSAAGLVGYVFSPTPKPGSLRSPGHFAAAVTVTGIPAAYILATYDAAWMYGNLLAAGIAVAVTVTVAWAALGWGLYRLIVKTPIVAPYRVVAALLFLFAAGCEITHLVSENKSRPRRPDVYVIVMDAFRADRLRAYGAEKVYAPFLERFSAEAAVFSNAYAGSSWTRPATATLFTSLPPSAHGVRAPFNGIPPSATTLAAAMRAAGYRTVGISANGNIDRNLGMGSGFDILDDVEGGSLLEAAGPPVSLARVASRVPWVPRWFRPWMSSSRDGYVVNRRFSFWRRFNRGVPTFFYFHYMEPHNPNRVCAACADEARPYLERLSPAAIRRIQVGTYFLHDIYRDPDFRAPFSEDEIGLARVLYDCEIKKMDAVVEELLAAVPADAVVVITADHGEELGEHGRWLHGSTLHAELARVPLLLRAPGIKPGRIAVPASLMDVAPTVTSLAAVAAPPAWRGMDLTPYLEGRGRDSNRVVLIEGTRDVRPRDGGPGPFGLETDVVVDKGFYYLIDHNARKEYFYDVNADPRQKRDLVGDAASAAALAYYRAEYARLKEEARTAALPAAGLTLDAETEYNLKSLGYL